MILDIRPLPVHQRSAALNAAIARHVLKRTVQDGPETDGEPMMQLPNEQSGGRVFESWSAIPAYSESIDAVIPLLAQWHACDMEHRLVRIERCIGNPPYWKVEMCQTEWTTAAEGRHPDLAVAICYALLRAHGVEVIG